MKEISVPKVKREKGCTGTPPLGPSLLLFFLFLITLSVYYRSLFGDFLNVDDHGYITDNESIRELSWENISRIFFSVIMWNYFPLQILSYAVDFHFWGLNPLGYRLTNLLLHIANAVLVFYLLRRLLGGGMWLPFAGSLIFALHPVNVESVAWISERKNVLSGFFFLLAFLAYLRYLDGRQRRIAYGASLAFYLLSVLAKVSSVVLPLLLLLYDLCWTSRPRKEWLKDKIPFFLISAFFSVLAVCVYQRQTIIPEFHGGHPIFTFLTMANVLAEYFLSLFVPLHLNFHYDTPIVKSIWNYQLWASLSLLFLLTLGGMCAYRKNRPLFFSLLYFLIPLLPVLNIVPLAVLRADRYLYLSSIGFSFFLVWGIPRILNRFNPDLRWAGAVVFGLIVVGFAWLTEEQTAHWKNTFTLWTQVIRQNTRFSSPFLSLANEARDRGQITLAETLYREALSRTPGSPGALNNLGVLFLNKGRVEEAHSLFQRALESDPDYPDAQINLGISYWKKGEEGQAIAAFEKAKRNKKNRVTASNNLGVIYQKRGDFSRALALFREAVQEDPRDMAARLNLAMALEKSGQTDEAIAQLEKIRVRQPGGAPIHYQLGRLHLKKGDPFRAAEYFYEALKEKPEDLDIHFQLAQALGLIPGQEAKSQIHFEKARRGQPKDNRGALVSPK